MDENLIIAIREKLDELELLDNSYFKKDRKAKMRELSDQIISLLDLKKFDFENANKQTKSEYYYLKGKTLDFIPGFEKEAEETL